MSSQDVTSSSPPARPGRWTVARDALSFLGGWALIFQQAVFVDPASVNEAFLVLGGSLVGVPGLFLGATSVLEAVARRSGTPGPSGSPPASP